MDSLRRIVVAGGGPVGSATALLLSRAGYPVTLVDAGESAQKICGEGLLPAGWEVISQLGLAGRFRTRSLIEGITYRLDGGALRADLGREAYGVERPELVRVFREALEHSEVEVWNDARVRDFQMASGGVTVQVSLSGGEERVLRADLLIGADGLHSTVRRRAHLAEARSPVYPRWGARCYFRSKERRPRVEVILGQGVESYLTPLGEGLYGLAFIWSPRALGRPLPGEGPVYQRLFQFLPEESRASLPPPEGDFFGPDRGIGPLRQLVTSPLHPTGRVALVGDASGYFDALTGEGLCLGLRQARALVNCLQHSRLADYPRCHRRIKFRHRMVVGGLLWLLHRPHLRDRVFGALQKAPLQFQSMIGFAVEEAPWWRLLGPDTPAFLKALVYHGA